MGQVLPSHVISLVCTICSMSCVRVITLGLDVMLASWFH